MFGDRRGGPGGAPPPFCPYNDTYGKLINSLAVSVYLDVPLNRIFRKTQSERKIDNTTSFFQDWNTSEINTKLKNQYVEAV